MQSSSRNGAKVVWLALHTTEGMMRAQQLRDWTSWAGSSHASNDETGVLMTPAHGFVPYDRAAWTLRNGNAISENLEQCGWAKWTRADWLARPKLLETTALWLADRSRARGIPLVRLSDADIRAKRPGVLGHGDYSRATGDGTHTDPGPGYPWDVVLDKARWLLNPTPVVAPAAPAPRAVPREAATMRSVQLDNPFGDTSTRTAVLTVDPVGKSLVMPAGSRAWVQWQAFFPGDDKAVATVDWLVFSRVGEQGLPVKPFTLGHRGAGSIEVPPGCNAVEIRVTGLPEGGVVGFHLDGLGHA